MVADDDHGGNDWPVIYDKDWRLAQGRVHLPEDGICLTLVRTGEKAFLLFTWMTIGMALLGKLVKL